MAAKKPNKISWGAVVFCITGAGGAIAGTANFFKEEIKAYFKDQNAKVEISTSNSAVELHKEVKIEARIDSIGRDDLGQGTLSFEVSPDYFSVKPQKNIPTPQISGSIVINNVPELKALKVTEQKIRIFAKYVSGDLEVRSNELFLSVMPPQEIVHPHFDRSDIGRVNLSGEWNIEVDGVQGKMTIAQGTDSRISGTYELPGGRWPSGKITGQKDGATFRVFFTIPGKEAAQKIRVAGHFEIQSINGDFIEIHGCAYHLLSKPNLIYNKPGDEGVNCNKPANYNQWKVLQNVVFYASSPFDKQDQ